LNATAAVAALLVLCGAGLRLPGLSDPPFDFHPTRQYRSAIIARGYSLDLLRGLPPASWQVAAAAARSEALIEPPVMEYLAARVYHVLGREDLAWARALAALAWSLGGLALFWLARQVVVAPAALAAVAVWTFLPFAIRASQSFQPDPLMTALMVLTLAAAVRHHRSPTLATGVLFAGALAAALLVKAVVVFFLGPALVALFLFGGGSLRAKAATVGIGLVAIAPAGYYYALLPLGTDYGPFPQLLRQPEFWQGWAVMLERVVSWAPLIAGLTGVLVATGELRRLLGSLLVGYFAFGIVFTHHIHTHDYYSLPLIPIVALGMAGLIDRISRARSAWTGRALAAGVCLACLAWGGAEVVAARRSDRPAELKARAARYERIGALVGHSTRVLALDEMYGYPLVYHGHMLTLHWPVSGDLALMTLTGGTLAPAEERLRAAGADFFVATQKAQLDAQPDLQGALASRHPLVERDGDPDDWAFVVYDLRRGILSATPAELSMFSRVGDTAAAEETVALYAPATSRWTVEVPGDGSVRVEPASGAGPATLRVSVPVPTAAVDRTAVVKIISATDGTIDVGIRIRAVANPNTPPFGFVDAPADPVALSTGPVMFQGWALDDTAMRRVWVGYLDQSGRVVALKDARRDGRRPDLSAVHPTAHDLLKAAWSVVLDAADVRDLSRPVQLRFFAEDGNGQRTEIGRRTIQ
jgi:hypothetical protein